MEGNVPHKCLRVADIQALIFGQLTRHDCVQLSQACTSFYDQAMNVVWAEVAGIVSLVRCMPPDALRESKSSSYNGAQSWCNFTHTIDFSRDLTPVDWQAFCKHAHRVRKFTEMGYVLLRKGGYPSSGPRYELTSNAQELVSSFICQRAAEPAFNGLFRRAILLEARGFRSSCIPKYLTYLCGNDLQSFAVEFSLQEPQAMNVGIYSNLQIILPIWRTSWPYLRFVKIAAQPGSEPSQADAHEGVISAWIEDLTHLESFEANISAHSSLVRALSRLPLLRFIKLKGQGTARPHVIPDLVFPSRDSHFRLLQGLSQITFHPDSSIPILRALEATRTLTNVELVFNYTHSSPEAVIQGPAVIAAISQNPFLESLDIQFVKCEPLLGTPSSIPVLSRSLLVHLFALRRLRLLQLRGFSDLLVSDEELQDAAEAWPDLELIDIAAVHEDTLFRDVHPPLTSLLGIQALYNGYPRLKKAVLTVNDALPIVNGKFSLPEAQPRDIAMDQLVLRFYPADFEGFEHWHESEDFIPMALRVLFPRLNRLKTDHTTVHDLPLVLEACWGLAVQEMWQIYCNVEVAEVKRLLEEWSLSTE